MFNALYHIDSVVGDEVQLYAVPATKPPMFRHKRASSVSVAVRRVSPRHDASQCIEMVQKTSTIRPHEGRLDLPMEHAGCFNFGLEKMWMT